jgi:hypothetical protein
MIVFAEVDRLAELADPVAERFSELGKSFRAEDHERNDAEEQDVNGIVDAHHIQASARSRPLLARPPPCALAPTLITSEAPPTLWRMEQTAPSQASRIYPPPGSAEPFWPAQLCVAAAIVLQLLQPESLTAGPRWLVPSLEGALLIAMFVVTPNVVEEEHLRRRRIALSLTAFVSLANVFALGELTHRLLSHHVSNGRGLIVSGVLIWLTNFLIFALWYWELDRGGPGRRAEGRDGTPDFFFPQMGDDAVMPPAWRPRFPDYVYVSLTNNTAFSPTDTMPLTPMAKAIMGVQSVVSLLTIGLIVSRAVNIL